MSDFIKLSSGTERFGRVIAEIKERKRICIKGVARRRGWTFEYIPALTALPDSLQVAYYKPFSSPSFIPALSFLLLAGGMLLSGRYFLPPPGTLLLLSFFKFSASLVLLPRNAAGLRGIPSSTFAHR